MSHTPSRRLSTGGLPPVQIRQHSVVEEAPSHDGTPCFTAWLRDEIVKVPQGWLASDFSMDNTIPKLSLQIYDTTPGSNNPDHLKTLAETLHKDTRQERLSQCREEADRIDVWGMPLATNTSVEERIAKCKAHVLAEISSRDKDGNTDFIIPRLLNHYNIQWQRAIVIIDRPRALWNEDEGGFLAVYWDDSPDHAARLVHEEDHRVPETSRTFRCTRTKLGHMLSDIRGALE